MRTACAGPIRRGWAAGFRDADIFPSKIVFWLVCKISGGLFTICKKTIGHNRLSVSLIFNIEDVLFKCDNMFSLFENHDSAARQQVGCRGASYDALKVDLPLWLP